VFGLGVKFYPTNQIAINDASNRAGWKFYATNQPFTEKHVEKRGENYRHYMLLTQKHLFQPKKKFWGEKLISSLKNNFSHQN
jgi:hypothetical protein